MHESDSSKVKELSFFAVILSLCIITGYVESFIPMPAVPGAKLGLCNIFILIVLNKKKYLGAFIIDILRVIIVGFMFGSVASIIFSLSGAILSYIVMALIVKSGNVSVPVTGICGGVSHNIAQILVASFVLNESGIMYYLPILLLFGIGAGLLTGIVAFVIIDRTKNIRGLQ